MKRLTTILLIGAIAIAAMAAEVAKPNLSGKWVLNEKESEMPRPPAMREGGPGPGGMGPGGMGPGGMGGGMRPPRGEGGFGGPPPGGPGGGRMGGPPRPERAEKFTIEQNGDAVTFHYEDGWSRTIRAGENNAKWDGARLVTSRTMGPTVTETYEVSADRSRLTITTTVTHGDGETTKIKRVFDAAK
jgi:hypothetical protein